MNRPTVHVVNGQAPISLAYLPPTERQTRSALIWAAALLIIFAALTPFSAIYLPQFNGFIPALDATIFVTELITAAIIFVHFFITRSIALLVVACGYLFSALMVMVHGLTFPGAFSTTKNLSGVAHFNLSIYLLWHLALPMTLFAYVRVREEDRPEITVGAPKALVLIWSIVGVIFLVVCSVLIAALGVLLLPPPVQNLNPFYYPAAPWLISMTMLICAVALFTMWAFRRSVLDQWLMIVLLASMVELAINQLGIHPFVQSSGLGSRFTLGFYTGRVLFSLVTSTLVLTALLAETSRLYGDVARANMLTNVVSAAQALSSEIELPNLTERLMTVVLRYAGADRGLLILQRQNGYHIEAEARAENDGVVLRSPHDPVIPETIICYVFREQATVILEDAAKPNLFSEDPYLDLRRPRSILCLPLVRQGVLGGLFYLENTLAPRVFTPERARFLELLASQAAISLENAALYGDLKLQVGLLHNLPVSAWTLNPDGTPDFVNQVWLDFSGQTLDFVRSHPEAWMAAVHPEDREMAAKSFWEGVHSGQDFAFENRSLRAKDGTYRRHLQQAVVLRDPEGKVLKFVGTTTDIDDLKRTEEALRQTQVDLAHVARVATLNTMTASIAHEVSQPLTGILTNADTCVRMLAADPPNLAGIAETVRRTIRDANRAREMIARLRAMFSKKTLTLEMVDLNDAAREVIVLSAGELQRRRALLQTDFADDLPPVSADRIQLQQVILNLLLNTAEAMTGVEDRPRTVLVNTDLDSDGSVRLDVRDSGIGVDPHAVERLFEAFYTTKPDGMGIGLSICRSIIESHDGRLSATANDGPGATFSFSIPGASRNA
jgi:PAS domain S-box-containing protein